MFKLHSTYAENKSVSSVAHKYLLHPWIIHHYRPSKCPKCIVHSCRCFHIELPLSLNLFLLQSNLYFYDLILLRLFHDHSHHQNMTFLLSISQGNSQHCRSTLIWYEEASHYIFCPIKDWLRQFNSGRFTCLPPWVTSACHQRSF